MSPILTQPLQTILEKKGPLQLGPIPCRHRSPGKPLLTPCCGFPPQTLVVASGNLGQLCHWPLPHVLGPALPGCR